MTRRAPRVVLRAGAATDTGRVRSNNQDSYLLRPDLNMFAVADGMGGAQGGEIASQLAMEVLASTYSHPSVDVLTDAFAEANRRIHEAAVEPGLRGMGTTAVAIALVPEEPDPDGSDAASDAADHLLVVNVGDSRAYLFRDGYLTQLTEDHSVVGELVRDGHITEAEAEAHPQRNIITRVLGVYPEVTADLWPVDPVRGDRFLLCSDGLFNEVAADQITAVLRRLHDPSDAAGELVRLANEGGGRDNITVIVVDVVDDADVAAKASEALAADPSRSNRAGADPAGFSTASPAGATSAAAAGSSRRQRRATRREARPTGRRVTWRVLLFTLLLLGVIGGAVATIQWYGTSAYFVGFDGDEVAIFRGRPDGVLWIDPTVEQDTAIARDEVPPRYLRALEAGHEHASLAEARLYVSNIERDITRLNPPTTTTTASTTTTSTPPTTPLAN